MLFSTCFFFSYASSRFDFQSGRPTREMGEISLCGPPMSSDSPRLIVEIELICGSDVAVRGTNRKSVQIFAFFNTVMFSHSNSTLRRVDRTPKTVRGGACDACWPRPIFQECSGIIGI